MKEIWLPVTGYEDIYEVSNAGNIKSLDREFTRKGRPVYLKGVMLRIRKSVRGYLEVKLSKNGITKTCTVHSLVAKSFIPNPASLPHVNHIDGNKLNANYMNLEWVTHSENMQHAIKTGLIKRQPSQYANIKIPIINESTGEVFTDLKDLCEKKGLKLSSMRCYLTGHRKNKSDYKYLRATTVQD